MRLLALAATVLLAGCQPRAGRVLLLDLTLSNPFLLESTAAPWHDAGYRVEYRRFYPHLTRADLARYRTLVLLGGREPEGVSPALTIGDLAILTEWVRRDGVVILGYGAGTLDRWVMNRWLAAQGAGITIGTEPLDAPAVPLPTSALDNAGFAPFPAGRNHVLLVRDQSQTLARAALASAAGDRPAVVAGSRLRHGLILVASRNALGSSTADERTRDFLVALARWTMRPAEWALLPTAHGPAPLRLAGAPRSVAVHPPPLAPPAGTAPIVLPEPRDARVGATAEDQPAVSGWIARQGMRVLWTRFEPSAGATETILRFTDAAALNVLATRITPAALADTAVPVWARAFPRYRTPWQRAADQLGATSLRWFPAMALLDMTSEGADEVDLHGELAAVPCALDSAFWRGALRPTLRGLARLGGPRSDLVSGVALDLDTASARYAGTGFCEADYRVGLAALGFAREEYERLAAVPPVARYDTLRERGALARYFAALEAAVAERATTLRTELRRLHPELRFAFRATEPPADWFSLGLLRGFSTREVPALLWIRDGGWDQPRRYRERGIVALSAVGIDPERVPSNGWGRLRRLAFEQHDGFWLTVAATDSVGRLIRRLSK